MDLLTLLFISILRLSTGSVPAVAVGFMSDNLFMSWTDMLVPSKSTGASLSPSPPPTAQATALPVSVFRLFRVSSSRMLVEQVVLVLLEVHVVAGVCTCLAVESDVSTLSVAIPAQFYVEFQYVQVAIGLY